MIDKISSVTHSVTPGLASTILGMLSIVTIVVGIILLATAKNTTVGVIMIAAGALLLLLAIIFREHSILVSCCGDFDTICVGRKNTDEFYERICTVLKMKRAGESVSKMELIQVEEKKAE